MGTATASYTVTASNAAGSTTAILSIRVQPPYTDVTFYWQFKDLNGNVYGDFSANSPGCGIANVDEVRVTMNGPGGRFAMTVPCKAPNGQPGATYTGLPIGHYTWTVEGRRLDFTVFSKDGEGDFTNFPFFFVTVLADYPNMDLWYQLPVGATCAGISEIAFELDNLDGGVVEYSSDTVFVACQAPPNNGFTMPSIPYGNYGYRFVSAVNVLGQALFQVCGFGYPPQAPLVQALSSGNAYTAQLAPATGICP